MGKPPQLDWLVGQLRKLTQGLTRKYRKCAGVIRPKKFAFLAHLSRFAKNRAEYVLERQT